MARRDKTKKKPQEYMGFRMVPTIRHGFFRILIVRMENNAIIDAVDDTTLFFGFMLAEQRIRRMVLDNE